MSQSHEPSPSSSHPVTRLENGGAIIDNRDGLQIHVQALGQRELEFSVAIPALDSPSAKLMGLLLQANSLGESVRGARFALDSEGKTVRLYERLRAKVLSEDLIATRLAAFDDVATFWQRKGAQALLDEVQAADGELPTPSVAGTEEVTFRV